MFAIYFREVLLTNIVSHVLVKTERSKSLSKPTGVENLPQKTLSRLVKMSEYKTGNT